MASKYGVVCLPSGNPCSVLDLIISQQLISRNGTVSWAGNKSGEVFLRGEWPHDGALEYISWSFILRCDDLKFLADMLNV